MADSRLYDNSAPGPRLCARVRQTLEQLLNADWNFLASRRKLHL